MSDSFEYTNQAAYDAAWPAVSGISPNATLDSTRASDGVKSVTTPSTASNSQYESIRSFTELGNPSASNFITFSFDFYDSSASAAPYRDFATIHDAAGSSAGQLVSMGLNNSLTSANDNGNFYIARILGFTPTYEGTGNPAATSGSYFKLNDGGSGTLRSTGWHNLKVVIDNSNFKFYVDNILSKTIANGVTLRSYDNVTIGSGLSSATAAGFDNMLVGAGAVPEPASLGILGCAAAGLLRRRKI